jgi:hypothetical protein
MNVLNKIYTSKLLYSILGVSLLYFLIKGLEYLLIDSYVPILFIFTVIVIIFWSFSSNQKNHHRILKFWAILIIIWSISRLGIWLILEIDLNLTESHIREQFGIFQHIISILMLVIGYGIIKETKRSKPAGNNV